MTSKGIRESACMAYDYLRANGKKIGIDRDLGEYDVNLQVMSQLRIEFCSEPSQAAFKTLAE